MAVYSSVTASLGLRYGPEAPLGGSLGPSMTHDGPSLGSLGLSYALVGPCLDFPGRRAQLRLSRPKFGPS